MTVLIPFGAQWLALSRDQLDDALRRGSQLMHAPTQHAPHLPTTNCSPPKPPQCS